MNSTELREEIGFTPERAEGLLMAAAENLRSADKDERRVEAAFRIAGQLDKLRKALLPLLSAARDEGANPYEHRGFVILNHLGQVWGPKIYDGIGDAKEILDLWAKAYPGMDLSKHTIVPGHSLTFATPLPTPPSL